MQFIYSITQASYFFSSDVKMWRGFFSPLEEAGMFTLSVGYRLSVVFQVNSYWSDLHKIMMFCQQMVINHPSEQPHRIEVHVTRECMMFNSVLTTHMGFGKYCVTYARSITLLHRPGGAYCRSSSCPEHQHAPSQSSETAPSANTKH